MVRGGARKDASQSTRRLLIAIAQKALTQALDLLAEARVLAFEPDSAECLNDGEVLHKGPISENPGQYSPERIEYLHKA